MASQQPGNDVATDDVQGTFPQTRMDLHLQLLLLFLLLLLPLAAAAASDGRVRRGALGSNQLGASQEEVVSGHVERRSSHALLIHHSAVVDCCRQRYLHRERLVLVKRVELATPEPPVLGHFSQPPDQAPRALRSQLESVRLTLVLFWWWRQR